MPPSCTACLAAASLSSSSSQQPSQPWLSYGYDSPRTSWGRIRPPTTTLAGSLPRLVPGRQATVPCSFPAPLPCRMVWRAEYAALLDLEHPPARA